MALGGPSIRPGIAGCSYPACQQGGYEQARRDLRDLLRKTRDYTPSSRLAAVLAWACEDLEQMAGMIRRPRSWGTLVISPDVRLSNEGDCGYSIDECPYDWCAVHDWKEEGR